MHATIARPQAPAQKLIEARRTALRSTFVAAWTKSPETLIPTPGSACAEGTVADVVADILAGPDGDALRHEMLQLIIGSANRGSTCVRASALVATLATRYSKFHAEDSLREEGLL